ncbi:hypothetical protein TMatcc_007974 [Talaromyces marneffei ATCC 18224]|uniref:Uncharacterized protein n=3 Tax=Talaromyces marneffei TaxID=37727 RepID=B6QDW5_TALMQ|nr:conserved hypothetical protein [Talaromyces marneffei ATCC 18224]
MTTKPTNGDGAGRRNVDTTTTSGGENPNPGQTHSSRFKPTSSSKPSTSGGVVGGSSTGAPAMPPLVPTPTEYNRELGSYNPSSGTGYIPSHRQQQQEATQPATVPTAAATSEASGSKGVGGRIKGAVAGIHGVGESIRGTFNATVDRAFNEPEGVAKNEAIGREGEYEVKSGRFAPSTKQREGLNTENRT